MISLEIWANRHLKSLHGVEFLQLWEIRVELNYVRVCVRCCRGKRVGFYSATNFLIVVLGRDLIYLRVTG